MSRASKPPKERTPAQRRRRRLLIALGVLLAILAYPVLGTLALWTGLVERVLRSEDLRVVIDNPAYTIWPGHFRLHHVGVYVNGDTQFTLEGDELTAVIRLFPLLRHKVHVTKLSAENVRYRMRVQVKDTRGIERRIAAYPPLPELPGVKVIREQDAAKTEKRESPYSVQVEGIDVKVSELWFMEYRYLGKGTLTGGFLVGPKVMEVGTSVQNLGPGELRFGPEQVIATNFGGRISAAIPRVNPEEHADQSFMDFVTARIALNADVQTLKHLSAYTKGVEISKGKGPFAADVKLEKGWLGKGSFIKYESDSLHFKGKGFGVQTDWRLAIEVPPGEAQHERSSAAGAATAGNTPTRTVSAAKPSREAHETPKGATKPVAGESVAEQSPQDAPQIHSNGKLTYVSLVGRDNRSVTIQIAGHDQEVILKSRQIGSLMALRRAHLRLPSITSSDLDDVDALLPEKGPLHVRGGKLRASANLEVDQKYVARGPVRLSLDDAKWDVAGVQLGADALAETRAALDLKKKAAGLENFNLTLAEVRMHVGDETVKDWWMNLASDRIVAVPEKKYYEAPLVMRAKNAEPLLEALAEKDKISGLIPKITSLSNLRVGAKVRAYGDVVDLTLGSLESNLIDVAGRIYTDGKQSRTALVIGGKVISVGIASDGKDTSIRPFAHADWLNERLRSFPKPIEQVRSPKP